MAAKDQDDDEEAVVAPPKKKGSKTWLIVLISVLLAVGASVGGSFFMMRHFVSGMAPQTADGEEDADHAEAEPEKPKEPPNYIPLDPAFVVNLDAAGQTRFLQVQVQLMTRDHEAIEKIKLYEPQLRNALLLLFSQQKPEGVAARENVEALQAAALAEAQRVLAEETGEPMIDSLFFTSFVVQ